MLENFERKGGLKMINLLTNWILSFLSLLNFLSFGVLDNIAVVYSILVITNFIVFVKLEATIKICDIWKKAGIVPKGLILIGFVLNALPQWYLWLVGLCFIALAYFLTPSSAPKKPEEPSIFAKIHDILMEEYRKSDFKAKASSAIQKTKNKAGAKPRKKLPPV